MSRLALLDMITKGVQQVGPKQTRFSLWTPTSFVQVRYKWDELGANWWFEAGAPSAGRLGPYHGGKSMVGLRVVKFCDACSDEDCAALVKGQRVLGTPPSTLFGGPNNALQKSPAYKAKYKYFKEVPRRANTWAAATMQPVPTPVTDSHIAATLNVAQTAHDMTH